LKIACLEEIALRRGFIDCAHMRLIIGETPASPYREYLQQVYDETQLCGSE
jgi:glucose-1-phosphate thymidylyltransferase